MAQSKTTGQAKSSRKQQMDGVKRCVTRSSTTTTSAEKVEKLPQNASKQNGQPRSALVDVGRNTFTKGNRKSK